VKSHFVVVFVLFSVLLSACVKDRIVPVDIPGPNELPIGNGYLYINEFVTKGSMNANEYGTNEDWIEIYNPQNIAITLAADSWYISDNGQTNPYKYKLPQLTIPAKGYLVIWCDGLNKVDNQIHTNFNLSAAGEDLILYYHPSSLTSGINVDQSAYSIHTIDGASEGRYPDGGPQWQFFTIPSIGASNN
jgi:hypothetical protein